MLMIRIGCKDDRILIIDVSKHASSLTKNDKVYKLVCAGVSSITIGLANAIEEMTPKQSDIVINDNSNDLNHLTIKVKRSSETLQNILNVGMHQLKTIALEYPNYIDYKTTEV